MTTDASLPGGMVTTCAADARPGAVTWTMKVMDGGRSLDVVFFPSANINPGVHLCFFGLYAPLNEAYLRARGADSILGGEHEAELRPHRTPHRRPAEHREQHDGADDEAPEGNRFRAEAVAQKHPMPVVVVDHAERKPSEN